MSALRENRFPQAILIDGPAGIGKKALAIPISPIVAGIWPSEAGAWANEDEYSVFWPKNSSHGFIKDNERGELLWLLLPRATIKADPTVMPTDDALHNAAIAGIWGAAS